MDNDSSNMESDEWSIGIIFYKLITNGVNPFPDHIMIEKKTEKEKAEFLRNHRVTFPPKYFKEMTRYMAEH